MESERYSPVYAGKVARSRKEGWRVTFGPREEVILGVRTSQKRDLILAEKKLGFKPMVIRVAWAMGGIASSIINSIIGELE